MVFCYLLNKVLLFFQELVQISSLCNYQLTEFVILCDHQILSHTRSVGFTVIIHMFSFSPDTELLDSRDSFSVVALVRLLLSI